MNVAKYKGKAEKVKLSKLNIFPGNARVHDERQLEYLVGELVQVGQTRPLLVNRSPVKGVENPIIAGNGIYEAMKRAGFVEAEVIWFDFSEAVAIERNIKDNRAYELGKVDKSGLILQLHELQDDGYDLEVLGYTEDEFEALKREAEAAEKELEELEKESPDDFDEVDEDLDTEYKCPKCAYEWSGSPK